VHTRRYELEGKPAGQIEKIVDGQINAFYKDNCLMKQIWVRDNKTPIENLVKENISRLQENIVVRRFSRFAVKEA
jgi:elongation factor Ts